jgi:hypothetical protein
MFNRSSRAARGALALAVLSFVAAACSGSSSTSPTGGGDVGTSQPPAVPADAPGSAPAPAGSPGVVTGHVGDKLIVTMLGGANADLTLVRVADPATLVDVDVNSAAPAGTRWVGLEITSVDHSPFAGQESVAVDGIGSDGKTLTTNAVVAGSSHTLGAFKECTPAGSQDPDQQVTLCPGFLLPTSVTLKSVGAKVGGAEIGEATAVDQAVWMVP